MCSLQRYLEAQAKFTHVKVSVTLELETFWIDLSVGINQSPKIDNYPWKARRNGDQNCKMHTMYVLLKALHIYRGLG